MGAVDRPWRIDAGLAREVSDAIGWDPCSGVAALSAVLPTVMAMGSTAKLEAIAAGAIPPGADPDPLARRLLDVIEDRAAATPGGARSPSWSCWVASTVMAALVDAAGLGPVHVAATRRSDDGAPVVDFHAAVRVEDAADGVTWLCDPYFGAALALPVTPGEVVAATGPLGTARARRTAHGGWSYDLGWELWGDLVLRFSCLGPALDPGDVHAMAAISVTHSGVPLRPYARLHHDGAIVDISESEDGSGVLHAWTRPSGRVAEVAGSWAAAVDRFAERTGTRITAP